VTGAPVWHDEITDRKKRPMKQAAPTRFITQQFTMDGYLKLRERAPIQIPPLNCKEVVAEKSR
jgi:hypothetical protein